MDAINELRRYLTRPRVRMWALSGPILVLVFCLPLLRPLRHPGEWEISGDEIARLATVQSLVERGTLALDESAFAPPARTGKLYADQPPMLAILLAGPYWLMHRIGLSFSTNPCLVMYLLTLIGVTIPVAA